MEDYTYDLTAGAERVLGAHMLEVCPSITDSVPSLEVHPLSIGGREDPVRLRFTATPADAVILGSQGDDRIDAREMAATVGTIPWEIVCRVGSRIERVYS